MKYEIIIKTLSSSSSSRFGCIMNTAIDVWDDESDWAWLPRDIVDSISEHVTQFADYLRFGSVCKSWRWVAQEENHLHSLQKKKWHILKTCQNRLPLLMVDNAEDRSRRSFYSIKDKATYDFECVQNKSFCSRHCFGSSHGWLFTIDKNMVVTLVNPFTDGIIHLPEFKDPENDYVHWEAYDYFIRKGILSSDPYLNPLCYEAIVIYGGMRRLAFYKCGDEAWTFLDVNEHYVFQDIQCYQGQVFALNIRSQLVSVDLVSRTVEVIIGKWMSRGFCGVAYLLKLGGGGEGDLIMVHRIFDKENESLKSKTVEFKVFKLIKNRRWMQIESLDNHALFLGDNCSLAISALDFPCCQPNSIFYTDDYSELGPYIPDGVIDAGIFYLKDASFGSHYLPGSSTKHLLPAIWIVPNFKY